MNTIIRHKPRPEGTRLTPLPPELKEKVHACLQSRSVVASAHVQEALANEVGRMMIEHYRATAFPNHAMQVECLNYTRGALLLTVEALHFMKDTPDVYTFTVDMLNGESVVYHGSLT